MYNRLASRRVLQTSDISILGISLLGLFLCVGHIACRTDTASLALSQALRVHGQVLLSLLWDSLRAGAANIRQLLEASSLCRMVRALVGTSAQCFVLLAAATLSRVVHRLGQAISQVEEVLWHSDGAQQVCLLVEVIKIAGE